MNTFAFAIRYSLLISLLVSTSYRAEAADFIPLGDFPEGDFLSSAEAVSDDGSAVIGYGTYGVLGQATAFRWTATDGMQPLADFSREFIPGGTTNNGSTVVGIERLSAIPVVENAIRWTAADGVQTLPGFPETVEASAYDVTPDGAFVVGIAFEGISGSFREGYLWHADVGAIGLGDLAGGFESSDAIAVSADGAAVAGDSSSTFGLEAYHWTAATGMVGLGELPGGQFNSNATNISADGLVVVGHSQSENYISEAFRWKAETGMVGLGTLAGYDHTSLAAGASGDGSVVVGLSQADSASSVAAFVWDPRHGMRNLQDVLINEYGLGDDLADWTLESARDISADGLTIVGTGENPNGDLEAWLVRLGHPLNLPEPATASLGIYALAFLAWHARRLRMACFRIRRGG